MDRSTLPYNIRDKSQLEEILAHEKVPRHIISFYKYTFIDQLDESYRAELYQAWTKLGILGRIYLAKEGINAQVSIPKNQLAIFRKDLDKRFPLMSLRFASAEDEPTRRPFLKLTIKIKNKIVADGLADGDIDLSKKGRYLSPEEFNQALSKSSTLVVDMRNHYESEVGHFKRAILPDVDTFREELPLVANLLKGKENEKVLLYCTGGIRCEKASSYLIKEGFKDVNQLRGGILEYAAKVKEGLKSQFIGRNFVFDDRLGENVTDDIISQCHQCGEPCNLHTNCRNDACHLLFIQCEKCRAELEGCCKKACLDLLMLPIAEQRQRRKSLARGGVFKSRLRPRLNENTAH